MFKSVMWIYHTDQQKAAWFEHDFCVNGASYVATLKLTNNGPFLPTKLEQNFANGTATKVQYGTFGPLAVN